MSNTATQFTQPIFKTTATQYTHPTFKTTATQNSLWTYQNHSSTSTKSQTPLLCLSNQTYTIDWNTHTHLHHQLTIIYPNAAHLYLHPKLQPIYHTTYHLGQLLNPHRYDILNFIHFSPSIFPYPPPTQTHIYAQLKEQQSDDQNHTHQHYTTTTKPFPQHTSQTQANFLQITAQT